MDAEAEQALEIIKRDKPNLSLGAITNIHERRILGHLIEISAFGVIDPARLKLCGELCNSMRLIR